MTSPHIQVPGYMVAVKTSKEVKGEGAAEMLREAAVMAQVSGHPNLVSLVGVVTSGAPLLLLLSLCEHGSLLSVLKDRKLEASSNLKPPFTVEERAHMALEVAKGMAHLTASSFVHRDLAARNVLVDSQHICKIADFGLARGTAAAGQSTTNGDTDEEEYYRSRTGTFPVRWTAPDSMQSMRFSEASDVWSFGITLLEVFSDGEKPYPTLRNAEVINLVQSGDRAEKPEHCSADMYALLLKCWASLPAERPTFARVVEMLTSMVPQTDDGLYASPAPLARGGGGGNESSDSTYLAPGEAVAFDAGTADSTYLAPGEAVAFNTSGSEPSQPAAAAQAGAKAQVETADAEPRQALAINDTYSASGPELVASAVAAPAGEDQYLAINHADGKDENQNGAEGDYLAVASALQSDVANAESDDDFDC